MNSRITYPLLQTGRFAGLLLCCLLLWLSPGKSRADALDAEVGDDPLLGTIAEALAAYGIDVTTNLNARETYRRRLEQPRLGRFPDLPGGMLPNTGELLSWEAEFGAGEIGGLAILLDVQEPDSPVSARKEFALGRWLEASEQARVFITFHESDREVMAKIAQVAAAYFHASQLFDAGQPLSLAGELYATAAQRLALDSREARRHDSEVTELQYLGERVRRDANSLFWGEAGAGDNSLARDEPAVFLKESLGDEFNQSTIREIVVPGGVALGETAELALQPTKLEFVDGEMSLVDGQGTRWRLPQIEPATLKALFDFTWRSEIIRSDAIVDIDGDGRVRIAAPLRDTDAGYAIMEADTQPFSYVRNLSVTKSVIIDTGVEWYPVADTTTLHFAAGFEVRFLSADNMRIAQTRAALEYRHDSLTTATEYRDSWGRDVPRLHDNLDYTGLGNSVAVVAEYAGWVGLFRALEAARVPFLVGRYAFMKLDKSGRNTPARY